MGRDGSHPAAPFVCPKLICADAQPANSLHTKTLANDPTMALLFGGFARRARSETAEIDEARARAAAVFDDALAAIDGRTAVVAVVAGDVVPIACLRRRRLWCTHLAASQMIVAGWRRMTVSLNGAR